MLTAANAVGKLFGGKEPRTRGGRNAASIAIVLLGIVAAGIAVWLSAWGPDMGLASEEPSVFPQVSRSARHFRVGRPAEPADADAVTR